MHLSEIRVYPVKSLRGVAVEAACVRPDGLEHDRRWMLVDEAGRFVSQREEPRLARFEVTLEAEGHRVGWGDEALLLPVEHDGPRTRVTVWRDALTAAVHAPGSAFFSAALGRPLRLVHLPSDVVRPAGTLGRPSDRVALADSFPFLLIGQGSLDGLNARLPGAPLPMSRFRPNLVVAGARPHAEDGWAALRIGAAAFRVAERCDRCAMTTLDPTTGERGPEPLRTLASYRRWDGSVWFGVHLLAERDEAAVVRVGDAVHVHGEP